MRLAHWQVLAGRRRSAPRTAAPTHPFLREDGKWTNATEAIAFVSFSARGLHQNNEFFDYATRYGSLRGEDNVTLFESLMESLGSYVGNAAARHFQPDALAPTEGGNAQGRDVLKWHDESVRREAWLQASEAKQRIENMAPLLAIDDTLLHRPVIALSNGQSRRARILRAMITGAQFIVLEEPFTGLDAQTRESITQLFARLHAKRQPRICLVLREQDTVPDQITHILRLDEDGAVVQLGPRDSPDSMLRTAAAPAAPAHPAGSYDAVAANAKKLEARADSAQSSAPLIKARDVTIKYGDVAVLQVSETLTPPR